MTPPLSKSDEFRSRFEIEWLIFLPIQGWMAKHKEFNVLRITLFWPIWQPEEKKCPRISASERILSSTTCCLSRRACIPCYFCYVLHVEYWLHTFPAVHAINFVSNRPQRHLNHSENGKEEKKKDEDQLAAKERLARRRIRRSRSWNEVSNKDPMFDTRSPFAKRGLDISHWENRNCRNCIPIYFKYICTVVKSIVRRGSQKKSVWCEIRITKAELLLLPLWAQRAIASSKIIRQNSSRLYSQLKHLLHPGKQQQQLPHEMKQEGGGTALPNLRQN